jgi:phosphate/phosphite/phosphonate ABC transporter binding protein
MTFRRLLSALIAGATLLALGPGCDRGSQSTVEVLPSPAGARKIVRVVASDENIHVFRKLAEEYSVRQPATFEIAQAQSDDVPDIIRKGAAELGIIARRASRDDNNADLNYVPFAWDGAVFVAGSGAGVSSLSRRQLVDIYGGRITNWKQLGGRNLPIRVIDRPDYSAMRDAAVAIAGQPLPHPAGSLLVEASESVLHALRKTEGAIACVPVSRTLVEKFPVVPLTIDGMPPVLTSDKAQVYPVRQEYGLVFRKNAPEAVKELANHFVSVDGIHQITSLALVPAAGNIPIASCHCRATDGEVAPSRKSALSGMLTIGVTPELGAIAQEKRYTGISQSIAEKLDVETRIRHLLSYDEVVHAFLEGRIDAAFVGSLAYARLKTQVGVIAIARPEKGGVSWYRGLIVVRADAPYRSTADLRGKRIAYVPDTSAGDLFMRERAIKAGARSAESFYGALVKASSHAAAARLVLEGKVDGAAVKDLVLRRLEREDPVFSKSLREIDRSPAFPENALVVTPALGDRQIRRLGELLLTLHQSGAGREALAALGADRFVPTSNNDYAEVYRLAAETGYTLVNK